MIQLGKEHYEKVKSLFACCNDTTCWTVLQGIAGQIWCDKELQPAYGICTYGDFAFAAGVPEADICQEAFVEIPRGKELIWVPLTEEWSRKLADCQELKAGLRYAVTKKKDQFDKVLLQRYIDGLKPEYRISPITYKIAEQVLKEDWSRDFCANYQSIEDYLEHGEGYVILDGEKVIAGASSYSYYDKGIEIEIATHPNYRRQGLATIVGARLVLGCVEKGLYPSWDAANWESVKTSRKLGYEFLNEYTVYVSKGED